MPIDSDVDHLKPEFRNKAVVWLHIVRDDLGLNVKVTETLRSQARQADAVASGASLVKVGMHQFGLALDFAIFDTNGVYVTDGMDRRYEQCGQIAEALGCVWGGRWSSLKDSGHIEFHPGGQTLQQIIASEPLVT